MSLQHTFSNVNQRTVALDCDGVILDFDGAFARVASDTLGRPVSKVSDAYSLGARYALTRDEFNLSWEALDNHHIGWGNLPLLPGAAQAVHRLQALGYDIHLVTGIDACQKENRRANLSQHGIEVSAIDCVGAGQNSKLASLLRLRPVMFVDDRLALLAEADFVPYRVFIDRGDTQDGHVVHEDVIRETSLARWVDHVERLHAVPPASKRRLFPA